MEEFDPWSGLNFTLDARRFCDRARVELVCGRVPGVAAWYVFSVVAARAKGRGLQSAGVFVSEGDFGILPTHLHVPHIPAG